MSGRVPQSRTSGPVPFQCSCPKEPLTQNSKADTCWVDMLGPNVGECVMKHSCSFPALQPFRGGPPNSEKEPLLVFLMRKINTMNIKELETGRTNPCILSQMLLSKALNKCIHLIMQSDARKKGMVNSMKDSMLDNVNTHTPQNKIKQNTEEVGNLQQGFIS